MIESRLRPDLAIGLSSTTFTEKEIEKLARYASVDNWAQMTTHMFFPFLMCQVKCDNEGLDAADRQNMHSCSVALRALLRIEQEADKYRSNKKMDGLSKRILVFSISHDYQDARLYGHYAIVQEMKWHYYRHRIRKFDLFDRNSMLSLHNFVRNILKSFMPEHVKRLKEAIAALSDPKILPESCGNTHCADLSNAASGMLLDDAPPQQDILERDDDGFLVPARPGSLQSSETRIRMMAEQIERMNERYEKLIEMNRKMRQEHNEEMDRSRKESEQKIDRLLDQLAGST